ncbi:hypothetical protein [Desulforhabdus sp. TSK]|uniref:hypothetical protein n=1 Tax=Desulforhabdus sp. TSK TaxID=2925014 RepID=UPI001FC8E040|nr:hypothetical protein [Desulforhabdus sp. TSK]GKT06845.1 hypothetical protein DSTSK_01500 [Desulforhabdus sp. TSK]
MTHRSASKDVRLHLVVPPELKRRLIEMAAAQNKKVSALVRESIEEKVAQMEQKLFEENMRKAYLDMADENRITADEFRYSDAENL